MNKLQPFCKTNTILCILHGQEASQMMLAQHWCSVEPVFLFSLTLKALKYFFTNHWHQMCFFSIWYLHKCMSHLFPIQGVDDILDHEVIDSVRENSQGNALVYFMISASNNFICISHKGRSVVDYCFVPYEQLGFYNNF